MKKIYLLLLFLSFISFSQNFQWVDFPPVVNGLSQNEIGYTVATDNLGNVYIGGYKDNYFSSNGIFGNLFIRKYNSSGQLIFEKVITGKIRVFNLTADLSGNLYFVGSFKNSITFEGGATINTSGTNEVPVIVKFDSNGVFQWNQNISNFGSYDHFEAVTTDANNNVYIGFDNFNNSQILKLAAANGALLQTIDQLNVQIITSLSVDNLGNIYASGSCGKTTSKFAGISQPTSLDYSYYAVKYNPNGVHQWTKYVQSISCLDSQISAKTPNNVYFSAGLTGAYAFGSFTSSGPSSGFSDDIFISKINASGSFEWIREVPGTGKAAIGNRNFLTSDVNGNVYFAGVTRGTTVWSPAISTVISGFGNDALILKYNAVGDLLMAKTAGGSSGDRCDGITVDTLGTIYVSGGASGSVTFDGITNSVGTNVPYIAKIGGTLTNITYNSKRFNIYPNPAQNEIFITNLGEATKGTIYSSIGQKIKKVEIKSSIDINELAKGFYFLEIEGCKIEKFIKN